MSEKHLATGSECPPQNTGILRCYSMKYCPYAERTRLVLNAKNIEHDIVNVNLKQKPAWLFEKNPLGKVPALELNDDVLIESLITCDYLDEKYPEPVLYPNDAWKKAKDRIMIELFSKVTSPMYKLNFNSDDASLVPSICEDVRLGLDIFEKELVKRDTLLFGGDKPAMLDYMIWPWMERLPMAQNLIGEAHNLTPKDRFPKLLAWEEAMKKDKAVLSVYITPEEHTTFRNLTKNAADGVPNYDFTLTKSMM